jgi:hypothetical protein
MSRPPVNHEDAASQQLGHCGKLLDAVTEYVSDWRAHGGRAFGNNGEIVLQTIFARSTRTYEAVVRHLGPRGFGEQAMMLNRSLFEDMVDAHWVSLNPELAFERLSQHHRYSQRLRLDVASRFPHYFGSDLPEMKPPMDEDEHKKLAKLFGDFGERSWTGLNIHTRFEAIQGCWTNEVARRQARFMYLWVQRENNETLHLSSYSLASIGGPTLKDNALHFRIGSTEHLLGPALLWAFWTYSQTVTLVFDTFELGVTAELQDQVVEPGLIALVSSLDLSQ